MQNLDEIATAELKDLGLEGSVKVNPTVVIIRLKKKYFEDLEKYRPVLVERFKYIMGNKYFVSIDLEPFTE